ncbi:phenylalanine--tRNA ligase subunit beta [Candidatus Gottesmanbacteria bacterium]|nr:phenylalanine--tRNA ligase subunit beta [Candidatus Gottesmanbacteria bacterium]
MNILVPDSWLREYLETRATTKQIKEYLSLCGPSIERVNGVDGETVYDVEITTNRPDSMSIAGIAREAAAILPRFGVEAKFVNDPYGTKIKNQISNIKNEKRLNVTTDPKLNPRWMSIVIDNVKVKPSPAWLSKKLEFTGIRAINNVVDITNYLMRAFGQPAHAFDYDNIGTKNGVPTMILRASKKGEKLKTLDGKTHTLPGDDIVIEDGKGALIDLCGIMGGESSSIRENTKTVVLFLQTYDPVHIRRTSMALAHRTDAATLFEKGLDSELVGPVMQKGIELFHTLASGVAVGEPFDVYPESFKKYSVETSRKKLNSYIGSPLLDEEIKNILNNLGFEPKVTRDSISVSVPSFRRDVTIDVDIIEEVARLYGYHAITTTLPDGEPPATIRDPLFDIEEDIKTRLRDFGYTETYGYSMLSENETRTFSLHTKNLYTIANPLSLDLVYMRPTLVPSILKAISDNASSAKPLALFELSLVYLWKENDLPMEKPKLIIAQSGENAFSVLKGTSEVLFDIYGISYPSDSLDFSNIYLTTNKTLSLGSFGYIGEVKRELLASLDIETPVTILELDIETLIAKKQSVGRFVPIPKYPPSFEDLALKIMPKTLVGELIRKLKNADPLISNITLLDSFENTRTLHVTYLSLEKNLTSEDVKPVRAKILSTALKDFGATLKS